MPSNRLSRSKQLRKKAGTGTGDVASSTRKKTSSKVVSSRSTTTIGAVSSPSTSSQNNDDEASIDMGAASTIGCILLLLCIGASLASSYIMIQNPGCMTSSSSSSTPNIRSSATAQSTSRTSSSSVASTSTTPVTDGGVAAVTSSSSTTSSKEGFPPQCTADQKRIIMSQLPPDDCFGQPYTQACSFNRGTTRGCKDNVWVREVYSSRTNFGSRSEDNKYTAVFVNNGCQRSKEFVDVMLMGSHDTNKYGNDGLKFIGRSEPTNTCVKPVTLSTTIIPSEAICITRDVNNINAINAGKQAIGVTGDEIKTIRDTPSFRNKLDFILQKNGVRKDQPIHYMLVRDDDSDILIGAMDTLKQVRYLEFEYNYKGSWSAANSFGEMIKTTLTNYNFVCYWNGVDQNLWRITDCWLTHYSQKWWSRIACVNVAHDDTKPLAAKMESIFEETLKKEQKYGGP